MKKSYLSILALTLAILGAAVLFNWTQPDKDPSPASGEILNPQIHTEKLRDDKPQEKALNPAWHVSL